MLRCEEKQHAARPIHHSSDSTKRSGNYTAFRIVQNIHRIHLANSNNHYPPSSAHSNGSSNGAHSNGDGSNGDGTTTSTVDAAVDATVGGSAAYSVADPPSPHPGGSAENVDASANVDATVASANVSANVDATADVDGQNLTQTHEVFFIGSDFDSSGCSERTNTAPSEGTNTDKGDPRSTSHGESPRTSWLPQATAVAGGKSLTNSTPLAHSDTYFVAGGTQVIRDPTDSSRTPSASASASAAPFAAASASQARTDSCDVTAASMNFSKGQVNEETPAKCFSTIRIADALVEEVLLAGTGWGDNTGESYTMPPYTVSSVSSSNAGDCQLRGIVNPDTVGGTASTLDLHEPDPEGAAEDGVNRPSTEKTKTAVHKKRSTEKTGGRTPPSGRSSNEPKTTGRSSGNNPTTARSDGSPRSTRDSHRHGRGPEKYQIHTDAEQSSTQERSLSEQERSCVEFFPQQEPTALSVLASASVLVPGDEELSEDLSHSSECPVTAYPVGEARVVEAAAQESMDLRSASGRASTRTNTSASASASTGGTSPASTDNASEPEREDPLLKEKRKNVRRS